MANIEPYRKILEDNHLDVNNVSGPQGISLELEYPALAPQINAALAQGCGMKTNFASCLLNVKK
ncbi:MAG: hypothetical protein IJS39_02250 [Synergistaceae bacterium]|nr:hypothetical protein [Synergistaceae bacterium]